MSFEILIQKNDFGKVPFERIPLVGYLARHFSTLLDNQVKNNSLETVSRDLIVKRGGIIETIFEESSTKSVLSCKGTLIISEHPFLFDDVFPLLASLPDRPTKDTYLIALIDNIGLGPNIKERIIPVYINDRPNQNTCLRKTWHKFGYNPPVFDVKEAKKKNEESMKFASDLIQTGKRIVIFPDGVHKSSRWSSAGVGKIITSLEDADETFVVFAHVEGENRQLMLLLPGINNVINYQSRVYFSCPIDIKLLLNQYGRDEKSITQALQTLFIQFKTK